MTIDPDGMDEARLREIWSVHALPSITASTGWK